MPPADVHDWIFDFVCQFLESDRFDASVMDFVDEKCYTFENEEENKFEYTDIHGEFKDHIEALISSNLGELGITSEMFFDSCEKGRNNRDINKQVFQRMIAMEDFQTFKKLMTKRNMELQLEAIRSYNASKNSKNSNLMNESYSDIQEDQEMEEALAASLRSGEDERGRQQLPVPDALRPLLEKGNEKQGPIGENEMQEILRRSLMEMEILHRQAELEQADLEQAVALSLGLEEEKLRLQEIEAKKSSSSIIKKGVVIESRNVGEKDVDVKEYRKVLYEDGAKHERKDDFAAAKVSSSSSATSTSISSLSRRAIEDDQLLSQLSENQMSLSMALESESNDEKYPTGFMEDSYDSTGRRRPSQRPLGKLDGLNDYADPKPLQGRLGYGSIGALPSITTGADALDNKKKQAAFEIRKAQDQLSDQRKLEEDLRKQIGNINPEDVANRAKHMAEQRDKLILKKKVERDRKVREEEERQLKVNADGDDNVPRAVLRAKAQAQAEAISKNESKGGDTSDVDEKKRSAMRLALARRMKLDLIENEEIKLSQLQEEQFADLDRKLLKVDQLRKENKQREIIIGDQLRRQQDNILRNVQKS